MSSEGAPQRDSLVPPEQTDVWEQARREGKVVFVHHPDTRMDFELPEYGVELVSRYAPRGQLYALNPRLIWQGTALG